MSSSVDEVGVPTDDPMLQDNQLDGKQHSIEETRATTQNDSTSIIDEDDETEAPLLQPVACRLISCMRAPCLKRTTSSSSSPGSQTPSSGGTISPEYGVSPPMTDGSLSTICSSFGAIKQMSSARPKRQVHFAVAPPESGTTYSRENYDRRPIECTRAGSMFDLSLPSRGMCPSYSGEADDEACTEDEKDDDEKTRDNKERMRGFARWAKLKNGGTILGGATLKYTSRSTETTPSEQEAEANTCRLPAHGIRSFGGLAGSIGRSAEVHSMEEVSPEPAEKESNSLHESISSEDQEESDTENAAFRQAVYAALSMSPNATPMPSPSVRTRWECVTSYFDQKVAASELVDHGVQTPDTSKEDGTSGEADDSKSLESNEENRTPRANTSMLDENSLPVPASLSLSMSSSSPSMDTVTTSSSPMSSRCSSTDTWSSHGFAEREMEMDAFENEFMRGMASFGVTAKGTEQDSAVQGEEARNDASSPCETSDSLETDQGTLSSTSMGCLSTQDWMSSCATSPEIGPSDGSRSPIRAPLIALDAAVAQVQGQEDSKGSDETVVPPSNSNGRLCPLSAFSKFPAFLSVHQRRAISQSAPASSSNSPCVQSADEGDDSSLEHKTRSSLQRNSSHSRKSRKSKRMPSHYDSPADSDDAAIVGRANLSGELTSPPRPRRGSAPRSKSMSAAQTATLKKSSFSACSFRSEIEDEGALGGF
ncbi:uncharacterized protein FA14DRAFT_170739 [Meira miltonrushii]|uniref:Uncharacterized protein n=1 Tax=Meira miltonrushii TaxID=1280837 RepID=A0A316VLN2_9BASI|nr:uncharacterized protein FA14DRAFT_170739 [Meira miltonrushii]PWN37988.1 hypothetical protein FA14DRAFT_170739 [Meira miltonrushii]